MLFSFLEDFFGYVEENNIDLYNEFSLQHELGIYLRDNLDDYKVQFERNVSFFKDKKNDFEDMDFIKKEIDISIFDNDFSECYAIELKYPRNGQYPEEMYSFIKDIKFMEQLKEAGFKETYCITLVDNSSKPFFMGNKDDGIYQYFRNNEVITGKVYKPTGKSKGIDFININGKYSINWIDDGDSRKKYLLTI